MIGKNKIEDFGLVCFMVAVLISPSLSTASVEMRDLIVRPEAVAENPMLSSSHLAMTTVGAPIYVSYKGVRYFLDAVQDPVAREAQAIEFCQSFEVETLESLGRSRKFIKSAATRFAQFQQSADGNKKQKMTEILKLAAENDQVARMTAALNKIGMTQSEIDEYVLKSLAICL